MTDLFCLDDPYLLEFEANVVARREHAGRPAVVLDRTAFYPEGGGQPCDTGTLDSVPVLAVLHVNDEILHVLERELPARQARGRVDAVRRRDHREQHHGQHLLSRAFVEVAGARTVSFHLGAEECSIDLDGAVDDDAVRRAEVLANEVVWEARPVRVATLSRREALLSGLDPSEQAGERVRVVEAEGFDRQPCGGTHPRNTAEVGVILVMGHERYKGGTRVRFLCGHRALGQWRWRTDVLARLGAVFSASPAALPEAVERLKAQVADARAEAEAWLEQLVEAESRRLAAESPAEGVVVGLYGGWTPEALRLLATRLTARRSCVALLAGVGDHAYLVFAQSEGLGHDIPGLLREAAARLGGRGGGRGNLAQGGSDRTDGVADALLAAAARLQPAAGAAR